MTGFSRIIVVSAFPRLLISAAHKSSGKTVFTTGLCAELTRRGHAVYPFKKGPDYIDPQWLAAAAGRGCYNLDFNTQTPGEIADTFIGRCGGGLDSEVFPDDAVCRLDRAGAEGKADAIAVIEANKGLYDGVSLDGSDSNAALAKLLHAPVVLVIDCEGMTRGIAPLLHGYLGFDPGVHIAGVVLNKVGGSRHAGKLEAAVQHYSDIPVVGCLPRERRMSLPQRHLGLIPGREHRQAAERIEAMRQVVNENVDLDTIVTLARGVDQGDLWQVAGEAEIPSGDKYPAVSVSAQRQDGASRAEAGQVGEMKLGVFFDAAFSFYYPDDFVALAHAGFRLVAIDALRDAGLPAVDALFIGGGFPEVHAAGLEANASLRAAVKDAIEEGLPAYAECGGLMYLSRSIAWRQERREMVGVIQADAVMCERPCGRGYVRVEETLDMPWSNDDGAASVYAGHEFHHAKLVNLGDGTKTAYKVLRGSGIGGGKDGIVHRNLLASFVHLRATNSGWPARFAGFVRSIG